MAQVADERTPRHPAIEELVRHIVAAHLECNTSEVRAGDHLKRDLGITRLGLVLVCLDIEDILDVALSLESLERVHTLADLSRAAADARRKASAARLGNHASCTA